MGISNALKTGCWRMLRRKFVITGLPPSLLPAQWETCHEKM